MSQVLILLRKSLLAFSRARAAIVVTFIVPVALIALFGFLFGLYGTRVQSSGYPIAVVNASPEPAAARLIDALKAEKALDVRTHIKNPDGTWRSLTEADVRAGLHDNQYQFALILPADLLSDDRIGAHVIFLTNPRNMIEAQMVTGMVQKTIFTQVPQLLGQSLQRRARSFLGQERADEFNTRLADAIASAFGGDRATIEKRIAAGDFLPSADGASTSGKTGADAGAGQDFLSRLVRIDTEQVEGKQVKNQWASRIVGGYAIMFLLFAVSGAASSMFEERRTGVFARILSSPVRPAHILWARFLFGAILGLAQIATLFLAGWLLFGLEIFQHLAGLTAIAMTAAAACSAFGIFLAAIAPSAEAASGLATLIVLAMSALGGAWMPTNNLPFFIQILGQATPVHWAVEGFIDVLWAGRSLLEVLPKAGILAGIAAVVMLFSIWRFKRSQFFE